MAETLDTPHRLVFPDRETDDQELTFRAGLVIAERLMVTVGWGDEETGGAATVALDPEDEERLLAWLLDRQENRRAR